MRIFRNRSRHEVRPRHRPFSEGQLEQARNRVLLQAGPPRIVI